MTWQPQRWIHGAELLYAKARSAVYPGDDSWLEYDQIFPCAGFGSPGTENSLGSIQGSGTGGPMYKQYGRIYRQGDARNFKWCGRGDRFEAKMEIGYPVRARGATTSALTTNAVSTTTDPLLYGVDMRITGLARIGLIIGGICVNFHGEAAVATQPGDGNGNTFLVNTPISPATAPRQHIRGRLMAILSTN